MRQLLALNGLNVERPARVAKRMFAAKAQFATDHDLLARLRSMTVAVVAYTVCCRRKECIDIR
jgi:hypothetical protein